MATVDELTAAVRKLSARVKELEGDPVAREQREVAELVGDGTGTEGNGFAAACAESNRELVTKLEAQAINLLRDSNLNWNSPPVLIAFRNQFHRLGASKLDSLIEKYAP